MRLALDGTGYLYVADANDEVRRIDLQTTEVSRFIVSSGGSPPRDGAIADASVATVAGFASGGPGLVYFTDQGGIRQISTTDARVTTLANVLAYALAYDGAGTLYFGKETTVGAFDVSARSFVALAGVDGQMGVQTGPLPASLSFVRELAFFAPGSLLAISENTVLRMDLLGH